MKNKRQTSFTRRRILLTLVLLIIIVAACFKVFSIRNHNGVKIPIAQKPNANNPFSGPTHVETQEVNQNKTKSDGETTPTQPSPTPQPTLSKAVKISNAYFDASSKQAVVQTELYDTGWQQCTLEFTQGAQRLTKTAGTLYQTQYSTCLGFAVPVNDFPVSGNWNAVIHVSNIDGRSYSSNQVMINVIR